MAAGLLSPTFDDASHTNPKPFVWRPKLPDIQRKLNELAPPAKVINC
jgi:hypothetical protein